MEKNEDAPHNLPDHPRSSSRRGPHWPPARHPNATSMHLLKGLTAHRTIIASAPGLAAMTVEAFEGRLPVYLVEKKEFRPPVDSGRTTRGEEE
jgi:hypothetical protein